MPAGWVHGHLGEIATVTDALDSELRDCGIETVLKEHFAGDQDRFVAWMVNQTKALAHAYDLAMRDADLETVIQFMQAKARRTRPFTTPEQNITGKLMNLDSTMLFTDDNGSQA
jgi:hypothetical protein